MNVTVFDIALAAVLGFIRDKHLAGDKLAAADAAFAAPAARLGGNAAALGAGENAFC